MKTPEHDVPLDEIASAALGGSTLLESLKADGFAQALRPDSISFTVEKAPRGSNSADTVLKAAFIEDFTGLGELRQQVAMAAPSLQHSIARITRTPFDLAKVRKNLAWKKVVKYAVENVTSDEPNALCQFICCMEAGQEKLAKLAIKRAVERGEIR